MPHNNIGALMPLDHEIAAPTLSSARIEVVSPWRAARRARRRPAWLAALVAAWWEAMDLYARGAAFRGQPWGLW